MASNGKGMQQDQIDTLRRRLADWYAGNRRSLPWRQTGNPYRIWVSEVMLQQTQVATVLPYYERFLERFPDLKSLANADLQEVLKLWEGLGYYARARHLHRAAQQVAADYAGEIPAEIHAFGKLPGVGDYIAAAVMSIAFHQPYAVVDGNVKRVLARLLCLEQPVNEPGSQVVFRERAEILLDPAYPGEFNQAMMEMGAMVCTPAAPGCERCPVSASCRAYQSGRVADYPKRLPAKTTPEYHIAAGVIHRRDQVLITQRQPEGLLGGLWEFPGGKVRPGETAAEACLREVKEEVNLTVSIRGFLTRVRHAYTHFRIEMDVFECDYVSGRVRLDGPAGFRWVRIDHLDRFPFPGANRKFIPLLKD